MHGTTNIKHIICLLSMVQQDKQGQFRRALVKNICSKYVMCVWLECLRVINRSETFCVSVTLLFLGLRIEERPPIWRVAVNKLNKQPRTADEGWSSSLGVGRGANNPSP